MKRKLSLCDAGLKFLKVSVEWLLLDQHSWRRVLFFSLCLFWFSSESHMLSFVFCSVTSVPHFNDCLLWFLLRSLVCLGTLPGCWCRKLCLWGLQAWCLWGKASWEIPLQVHSKIFKALFAFWCYTFDKMYIPYLRKITKCQNNWYTEKVIKQHTAFAEVHRQIHSLPSISGVGKCHLFTPEIVPRSVELLNQSKSGFTEDWPAYLLTAEKCILSSLDLYFFSYTHPAESVLITVLVFLK